ncbi:MAG: hypothetical protein AAGG45_08015 [Pseudomonadota bacterium]
MPNWLKLEIVGRILVLFAIFVQLIAIGVSNSEMDKGRWYKLNENQVNLMSMVKELSKEEPDELKIYDLWADQKYVTAVENSNFDEVSDYGFSVFVVCFLIGSFCLILARIWEVDGQRNQ